MIRSSRQLKDLVRNLSDGNSIDIYSIINKIRQRTPVLLYFILTLSLNTMS